MAMMPIGMGRAVYWHVLHARVPRAHAVHGGTCASTAPCDASRMVVSGAKGIATPCVHKICARLADQLQHCINLRSTAFQHEVLKWMHRAVWWLCRCRCFYAWLQVPPPVVGLAAAGGEQL